MSAETIQPYISISPESGGAIKAIAWYKDVFGAIVKTAMVMSCGEGEEKRVGHAELAFGKVVIMLSDQFPGAKTPKDLGGNACTFFAMFPDSSKAVYDKAIMKGATVVEGKEYKPQPWGWTCGTVEDPFGYVWTVGEDTEKMSNEEIGERLKMTDISSQF
jgi:PhnB protein